LHCRYPKLWEFTKTGIIQVPHDPDQVTPQTIIDLGCPAAFQRVRFNQA
jgi:hypothetical protein